MIRYGEAAPHVARITVARPEKRNGFTAAMLDSLADAFTRAEDDPAVRVLLIDAEGGHFTGGLDLGDLEANGRLGKPLFPAHLVDPVGLSGRERTKPVVIAIEGVCFTLGVELILAADIVVAGASSRFAQIEVKRGIMAYAGATIRMVERFGWGNAMRWLLTGDVFDAASALRLGLVQELCPDGQAYAEALAIARRIAAAAPLAVRATLASARLAERDRNKAIAALPATAAVLAAKRDAAEGVAAFREKRAPRYIGV